MRTPFPLIGLFTVLSAFGCGGKAELVAGGGSYFEVAGAGVYAQPGSDTQRKALARDAAISDARSKLLARVRAAALDDGRTLELAEKADAALEDKIDRLVDSADVVRTEFAPAQGCSVTLRLPKQRIEDALNLKFQ